MIRRITISILTTLCVSLAFASGLHFFNNFSFWAVFTYCTLSQFVLFYILGLFLEQGLVNRGIKNKIEEQTQRMEAAVKSQSLDVECAYCNVINNVPIIVTQETVFQCYSCKESNSVRIQYFAARITKPIISKIEAKLIEQGLPDDDYLLPLIEEREKALKVAEEEKKKKNDQSKTSS